MDQMRRWIRERAEREEREVAARGADMPDEDTLRRANATLAREMSGREPDPEVVELRRQLRHRDARLLMKDSQILRMKKTVDEQNLEIYEYKEQVAELKEKLENSQTESASSKATFAARAQRWRQKVSRKVEEVFTDFQLKCHKQIKEQLSYAREEVTDLRQDLQESRGVARRLWRELMVLHDDMDDLQHLFSLDRWEDVIDSAARMKDRCAELEKESRENKRLRQELDCLHKEMTSLRSSPCPQPTDLEVVQDSIPLTGESQKPGNSRPCQTEIGGFVPEEAGIVDTAPLSALPGEHGHQPESTVTLTGNHDSLCEKDAAILDDSASGATRPPVDDDPT